MGQITLSCTKQAWTRASTPDVNYRSGDYATRLAQDYGYAYLGFAVPDELRFKPLESLEFYQYGITTKDQWSATEWSPKAFRFVLSSLQEDWDENTVTYNNAPGYQIAAAESESSGFESLTAWCKTSVTDFDKIYGFLTRGFRLQTYSPAYGVAAAAEVQVSTRYNTDDSLRPYIIVYFDDQNVYLTPTLLEKSGYTNPHKEQRFYWSQIPSSFNSSLETPTQIRAVFSYKLPAETTWQTLTLEGSENNITVPADTLPAAESVQWKITLTDSGGTTTESEISTILTKDSVYTVTARSPADNMQVAENRPSYFYWTNSSDYSPEPTGAELQWSEDLDTWQTLATVEGSATRYMVPANTFPGNKTLFWRVRSFNADGEASDWSQTAVFNTRADLLTATPEAPIDIIIDSGKSTLFSWTVSGIGASYSDGVELQISTDGTEWTTLANVTTPYYQAPASSLPTGQVFWRVRAYNRQNVPGDWSEAVSFIVYGAPGAPIVTADGVPFATISWQSQNQQGYRLEVDGTAYGPFLGTATSFVLPDYLADGEHTVSVFIQGSYGLWSNPGNYVFVVENLPGDPVILDGVFDLDASLRWTTSDESQNFLIYRDGNRIAKTTDFTYVDRMVLGAHTWQVINRLPDGNYTASNAITGTLQTRDTMIADMKNPGWISLRLSANSNSAQTFTRQRSSTLRHISGAVYPVIEMAPYEDFTGNYETAFSDKAQADAFEALFGKVVIVKSRRNNVIVGALTRMQKQEHDFFTAFSFTLQQIDWEDPENGANG